MAQHPGMISSADPFNNAGETMRQLTYIKKNVLEWWEVKDPVLQLATDVIVRPFAAARCDGDKVFLLGRRGKVWVIFA
jgi:hypothetical protein